jgi:hypothetical protein
MILFLIFIVHFLLLSFLVHPNGMAKFEWMICGQMGTGMAQGEAKTANGLSPFPPTGGCAGGTTAAIANCGTINWRFLACLN